MPRPPRPVGDDLVYHVLNWTNNHEVIFQDEFDFHAFLDALTQTQKRYPFRLYGYCLMANHFHLLLRTEAEVSISRVLQSLTVAHTWYAHRRYGRVGHVWQGRFRSPIVQDDVHLWEVLRYIEGAAHQSGEDWCQWSSYQEHGLGQSDPLLTELPGWSALGATEDARRSAWRDLVQAGLPEAEVGAITESLRSGRPYGDPAWIEAMGHALGISWERRPRGRPRKRVKMDPSTESESGALTKPARPDQDGGAEG
jgi:putative transposase